MAIPETGFIANVNSVADNIDVITNAATLFDSTTVAILNEIANLNISLIVTDLAKSNYLGNRKLDINLALNNTSTIDAVSYSQANILLKDGTYLEIPFVEQLQDLSWVTLEYTSHADIKNYIQNSPIYTSAAGNTELTVEDAIGDKPQVIRFRDTDGTSSNVDRVDLVAYSGSYVQAISQYFWSATTSSLQTLANRAADILLLGQSIDDIIVLANITNEIQNISVIATEISAVYADLANILSVYNNLANIQTVVSKAGDMTTVIAMTASIDAILADQVNIDLVAAATTNIANVLANMAAINTTVSLETAINTVVGMEPNIASVVADKIAVDTVASLSAAIGTVNTNSVPIGTVATNIASVNTVSTNIANINTVSAKNVDITTVADDSVAINSIVTNIVPNLAEILLADANAILASTSKDQAAGSAVNASIDADNAAISAGQALTYLNQITNLSTATNTLVAGSAASASYNSGNGLLTFGIPQGNKGDRGDAFTVDAFGSLAGKVTYDDQALGFAYLAVDTSNIYFKQSATTADWSAGVPFGKGDQGIQGEQGFGWLVGTGVPSDIAGVDGDSYLNETNADVYYKVGGTWGAPITNLAAAIDDGAVSTLLAWSSNKITAQLALKSNTTHNHTGVYEPANANIQSHISNLTNPHATTKVHVGLGNVTNTSDVNKPVSTAQQAALDGKENADATILKDADIGSTVAAQVHLHDLAGLTDTTITTVVAGELLKWSGTAWINNTLAEAGVAAAGHVHSGVYEPADATIVKDADIGVTVQPYDATLALGANKYVHPTYLGDDISVDTTPLTGAVVISDLAFNVTTDLTGHVVDANAAVATRTLTLANLGYTGATNANNYVHPSIATTNINTAGSTIIDSITTTAEGHISAMATRVLTAGDLGAALTTGNVATATKLATARAITLTGDVTGTANFDGSAGINISATVANDSHTHSAYEPAVVVSQAEAEAGTSTANRTFTPERVKQAINALTSVSTTYGAVGTYVFGHIYNTHVGEGSTYAGSSIEPAGSERNTTGTMGDDSVYGANFAKGGATLSGTWRAMGRSSSYADSRMRVTLFVRIS